MIKSISTIEGLGGCGKTFTFLEKCNELKKLGMSICYLTFNKRIAEKTVTVLNDSRIGVHTLHSLMYKELEMANMLPVKPKNYDNLDSEKNEISKFFKEVERTFLKYFSDERIKLKLLENNTYIFVDEYQNIVDKKLIKALILIGQKINVEYIFIGDRYQSIYDYLGKGYNAFDSIEETFNKHIYKQKILRINHRSNPSVLRFINSFIKKNMNVDEKYLYKIRENEEIKKQKMYFFTNRQEEFEYKK